MLGPGAIGLLAAQAVRAAGGRVTVVGTERDTARLQLAARSAWKLVLEQHKLLSERTNKPLRPSG